MKAHDLQIVAEKLLDLMDNLEQFDLAPAHVVVRLYDPEEDPQDRRGAPGTATDVKLTRGGDISVQPQRGNQLREAARGS